MRRAIAADETTGVQLLVARHGRIVMHEALGLRDLERQLPMERNTLLRMASVTKPVVATGILMLVDEGRTAWRDAREHQVQARVLVHAFAAAPFAETAAAGVQSALLAHGAGEAALQELQVRRRGLAVATLLVLAFLVTLGLKIRRLPGDFR